MKKELTLTVKQCAEFLRISEQKLRIGLQRRSFPFGCAIGRPSSTRLGFTMYTYHIPKFEVEKYMGITYEEFLKQKGEINDK